MRKRAKEAADVVAFLADRETYARLVRDYGWTFEGAESGIAAALVRLLVAPAAREPASV
jgi:hypothetical protein